MSASLAFYAILSLVPLMTVAMSLAAWLLGSESARQMLARLVHETFGPTVAESLANALAHATQPGGSVFAVWFGAVVLLSGGAGVAGELRMSLNQIWQHPFVHETWMVTLRNCTRDLILVLILSVVTLALSVFGVAVSAAGNFVSRSVPGAQVGLVFGNFVISLAVLFALFLLIHRCVPDASVPWRQALIGAACTATLFTLGKDLVTFYIGKTAAGSAFGAGRSAIILLLWAYFSCAVLFFGAEVAHASGASPDRTPPVPARPQPTATTAARIAKASATLPTLLVTVATATVTPTCRRSSASRLGGASPVEFQGGLALKPQLTGHRSTSADAS